MNSLLTLDQFADKLAAAVVSREPGVTKTTFWRADAVLSWSSETGEKHVNVGNYYRTYTQNPEHLDAIIASIFRNPENILPSEAEERQQLIYPHIQDRWTPEQIRMTVRIKHRLQNFDTPKVNFAEYFCAVMAYDLPDQRSIINSTEIETWDCSWVDQMNLAFTRLMDRTTASWYSPEAGGPLIHISTWKDGYDAARVLADDFIRNLKVRGLPVIFMPTAEALLVTGSDDYIGQGVCFEFVTQAQERENKPLPPVPIILKEDGKHKYHAPPDNLMRRQFINAERNYLFNTYKAQHNMLTQINQIERCGFIIAPYNLLERKDKFLFSSCDVWYQPDLLIPKTDQINFYEYFSAKDVRLVCAVTFERFQSVMQDCLTETEFYPTRLSFSRAPTPGEIAALQRH